jgi:hypothetical protein
MKRRFLIFFLIGSFPVCLRPQGIVRWFTQSETEIQYYLQQISALAVYASDLKKGYSIAQHGLGAIAGIKQLEYSLHQGFFHSLDVVNPAVSRYDRVGDILSRCQEIILLLNQTSRMFTRSTGFLSSDRAFGLAVIGQLEKSCSQAVDDLMNLLTDDKLQLSDDARIRSINRLNADMVERAAFAQSFQSEMGWLALQRSGDQESAQRLQNMYGINATP